MTRPASRGTIQHVSTKTVTFKVGKKGRVVIPASLRKEARITEGTELTGRVSHSGQVILETRDAIKQRIRARAAAGSNDRSSVVDELLEERRADRSLLD